MPRYLVERAFAGGAQEALERALVDADVTWIHSYVSDDGLRTYCVYEAPTPEAVRKASARHALPVERITRVRVLDSSSYA